MLSKIYIIYWSHFGLRHFENHLSVSVGGGHRQTYYPKEVIIHTKDFLNNQYPKSLFIYNSWSRKFTVNKHFRNASHPMPKVAQCNIYSFTQNIRISNPEEKNQCCNTIEIHLWRHRRDINCETKESNENKYWSFDTLWTKVRVKVLRSYMEKEEPWT